MLQPLLNVRDLSVHYATRRGALRAVDGVSLTVVPGEAVGLVGESGCGKSTLGQAIMGLIEPPGRVVAGSVVFEGEDLLAKSPAEMRRIRGARISMIFQDPGATLNPLLTVGEQIAELLRHHTDMGKAAARERVLEMLAQVGISQPATRYHSYPHEFSGGMQQRVIIACALILEARLVIADEPTTALDVTIQAQILDLLQRLQDSAANAAIILVSHDLGVVAQMCDRVAVMYAGSIVEMASIDRVLEEPRHPYSVGLIASIPRHDADRQELSPIPGFVADPIDPPSGCKFHPRCSSAHDRCRIELPKLLPLDDGTSVACHLYA